MWETSIILKRELPELPKDTLIRLVGPEIILYIHIDIEAENSKAARLVEEFVVEIEGKLDELNEKWQVIR